MINQNIVLQAVTSLDQQVLENLLKEGWLPQETQYKNTDKFTDLMCIKQCILSDWLEGLKLFYQYTPNLLSLNDFYLALKSHAIHCLPFLWKIYKKKLLLDNQLHQKILTHLLLGYGDVYSSEYEKVDIRELYRFFNKNHVELNDSLHMSYIYHDISIYGHSLFTRLWMLKKYDQLNDFFPKDVSCLSWERLNETLFHSMDMITDTYITLENSPVVIKNEEKKWLLKFLKKYGQNWISQIEKNQEPNFSKIYHPYKGDGSIQKTHHKILSTEQIVYSVNYCLQENTILEDCIFPQKYTVSSFIRLPLFFKKSERQFLWKIWNTLCLKDTKKYFLKTLIENYHDKDVQNVVDFICSENKEFVSQYWQSNFDENYTFEQVWNQLQKSIIKKE